MMAVAEGVLIAHESILDSGNDLEERKTDIAKAGKFGLGNLLIVLLLRRDELSRRRQRRALDCVNGVRVARLSRGWKWERKIIFHRVS